MRENEMKTIYETVRKILINTPEARDNDFLLYGRVFMACGFHPASQTVDDMFRAIQRRKVPPMESVTRLRRLAQRRHPELMGKRQKDRDRLKNKIEADIEQLTDEIGLDGDVTPAQVVGR